MKKLKIDLMLYLFNEEFTYMGVNAETGSAFKVVIDQHLTSFTCTNVESGEEFDIEDLPMSNLDDMLYDYQGEIAIGAYDALHSRGIDCKRTNGSTIHVIVNDNELEISFDEKCWQALYCFSDDETMRKEDEYAEG